MKYLRWWLLLISLLLTVIFIAFSSTTWSELAHIVQGLPQDWWQFVGLAVVVQLVGHWLRTLRTKTVIDMVRKGKAIDQFGALAVGYLFNALLPFRIGEMIRAILISVRLRMSFLYTFTVIVLERAIDLLFVGLSVIVISLILSGKLAGLLFVIAIGAIGIAAAILIVLFMLVRENRFLLNLTWRATGWFNADLSNRLRFKVWSLIFGLQQFVHNKPARRKYIGLTVMSWVCYIVSMLALVSVIFPSAGPIQKTVLSSSPYVAVSTPSGPATIPRYEYIIAPVLERSITSTYIITYVILSWLVLTVPMMLVGYSTFFWLKVKPSKRTRALSNAGFANKLSRREDISQAFPAFLESYFLGHDLSHVLHKIEVAGELSLVKFFKGGSDAITVLVLSKNKLFVKKIIPLEHKHRLKAQYDWLKQHKSLPYLVKSRGEQTTKDYYAIDLAYSESDIGFFEYIHLHSLSDSETILKKVYEALNDNLYTGAEKLSYYPNERAQFVKRHIFDCIEQAVAVHPELRRAVSSERIKINGKVYDNLERVMKRIKKHPQAWRDIATYQRSETVHGDPTVDNILVSTKTGKPLIIDPAPDGNIINGPVFDMGKLMQSFYCGYEFMFRDEEPVHLNKPGVINYRDHRSERYVQLCQFVENNLAPSYLEESERRALLFHAATLHLRRLKHQAVTSPANTLKFYAVGIKTLNEFLEQYN